MNIQHEIWMVIRLPLLVAALWVIVSAIFSFCIARIFKDFNDNEPHNT